MKTLELLSSLVGREKREFDFVMKNHRRKTLQLLYKNLFRYVKATREVNKNNLFQKVFNQTYSPKKDYLLRNELRLLTEELLHFFVQKEFHQACEDNPNTYNTWVLRALHTRKLSYQFNRTYKQAIRKAKQEEQYDWCYKILSLKITHTIKHEEIREDTYKNLTALAKEALVFLQKDLVRNLRGLEVKQAFCERTIHIMDKTFPYTSPITQINLEETASKDNYANYLNLQANSFKQEKLEKIETLHKALVYIKQCPFPTMNMVEHTIVVLASIALEYYLMADYKSANTYYEQTITYATTHKYPLDMAIVFNFFSNKIKLADYEGAIQLFEQFQQLIEDNERVYHRFLCLKGMCHIFLKQPEQAMTCITSNIQQRPPSEYYYFKFIHLLALYQQNDSEAALRETNNLIKVLHYHHNPSFDINYLQVAKLFARFFKMDLSTPEKAKEIAEQIQKELVSLKQTEAKHLLLIYLNEEMNG